jgi:predicted permease
MLTKLRALFYGSKLEDEIDRELSSHLAMEIEHRRRQGMSAEEARRTALRDFGGVARTREEVRDARGMAFWDVLKQDIRFGLRSLSRSPGYALASIAILALGIGANTAMFSVIQGVLLKPLPFRNPDRVAVIENSTSRTPSNLTGVSINELYDYRSRLTTVQDLVEYHQMSFVLLNQGDPDRVDTGVVSANFFTALGVQPLIGRDFVAPDAKLGAQQVVLLTYEYWQSKFSADPKVVDKVVEMNNAAHRIIGVLPPFPQYPDVNDIYMPTSACPFRAQAEAQMATSHRSFSALSVFGWLAPGATAQQASAEISGLAAGFQRDYPKDYPTPGFTGAAKPLKSELVKDAQPMLLALTLATVLVLIIACANVANLAIARTVRRQREFAVRVALGAGRRRLIRQLVTESLITALIGGVGGVLLAKLSLAALVSFIGRFTSRTNEVAIDAGVLGFAVVISVITGIVCGVLPALGSRLSLASSMRDGAAQAGDSRGRRRVRSGMVVAQVSVSFVLLIGAALLMSSVYKLATTALGFEAEKVVTAALYGNFSRNQGPEQALAFYDAVIERLRAEPGVTAVASTNGQPLATVAPGQRGVKILGLATESSNPPQAINSVASEDYFKALDVPILRGRAFTAADRAGSPPVIIINQSLAKSWQGRDPIGTYIQLYSPNPNVTTPLPAEYQVVGIVPDFQLYGPVTGPQPQTYRPVRQAGFASRLLVRTAGNPADLTSAIRRHVLAVDSQIPVENIETLQSLKLEGLSVPALTAGLLAAFAGVALAITLAGIAGLVGTSVSQRTREFGVRMALGARPWSIVSQVIGEGLLLVIVGIVAGSAGAYAFSRVIAKYLFHTTPTDPRAYAAAAAIFIFVAALAAFGPAKRITGIDPLKALKTE